MSEERIQRKLAALFAADVAGYGRLMALDEEKTTRTLSEYRVLMDGLIGKFGGRIANTAGDSVLAEFSSSVEAVRCATETQEALRTRNQQLRKENRVEFRIGISVGDVIEKDGDLLGDGVNVAARLESIAQPGGICVSGEVRDQIEGKIALECVSLGNAKLKNLGRPIRAYALGPGSSVSTASRLNLFWSHYLERPTRLMAVFLAIITALLSAYFLVLMNGPTEVTDIAEQRAKLDQLEIDRNARKLAGTREVAKKAFFSGNEYWLVRTWGGNWHEAEAEARVLGGHLAAINSKEEDDFIRDFIIEDGTVWVKRNDRHRLGPWIGLIQSSGAQEPSDGWKWSNGDDLEFQGWYSHQPDNWDGIEDVARFHHYLDDPPARWGDSPGTASASGYVIEFVGTAEP